MSCASPIPQLSPPSLHMMYNARHNLDDDPDPLHHRHSSTFSFTPSVPCRSPSRPALTDILLQRHNNSPQNKAGILSPLSPRKACKENRAYEEAGENGGRPVDAGGCSPSPSALKRKRPAKLAIPEFARMASFEKVKDFELPDCDSSSSKIISTETSAFAVSCKKGRKDCMEDAHAAITSFQGQPNQGFFGVFDGHGGKSAAQFAAENLGKHIATEIENLKGKLEKLETAMQAGYLVTDKEFLAKGLKGGACSLSAYLMEGHLVVANAGDCRAVLCRNGKAEALSESHRASNLEERERIESLGGFVDCFNGVWRVQGTLAVTRSFGDMNLKQWIIAEPQVRELSVSHDCEFLILASDGLWDKVSDQEAVDCCRECLQDLWTKDEALASTRPSKSQRHHYSSFPTIDRARGDMGSPKGTSSLKTDACNRLIHKACGRGNIDDITVMIISLREFATA